MARVRRHVRKNRIVKEHRRKGKARQVGPARVTIERVMFLVRRDKNGHILGMKKAPRKRKK